MYVYAAHVFSAQGCQKKVLDPLKLEFHMACHYVGALKEQLGLLIT